MKHKSHNHQHTQNLNNKKLLWVALLNFSITIVQIVGGIISNSLSLLSDAWHNLGDSVAILIAYFAAKISKKKPNERKTFGYKRIEIIAALFNSVMLISISIFLFFEAYKRFINPEPIKGKIMFIIALFGLAANLLSVIILNKNKKNNLNFKAAYLHLLGDTLSSVAVILGGIAIWIYKIYWVDSLITVIVSFFLIYHSWNVVKQTVDILMQSTPADIKISDIKKQVEKIENVENIHHIHVWKLDEKQTHLEAHIYLKNDIIMSKMMSIKKNIELLLKNQFKINHITLQIEYKSNTDNNDK